MCAPCSLARFPYFLCYMMFLLPILQAVLTIFILFAAWPEFFFMGMSNPS